jgi:2-amino-4-hydroxy-6-hydroxymethyldihydropteridine diphosphokinase
VLLYDDMVREKAPQLPRHEITENAFVLWPLAEIAGNRQHPILKKTYGAMWRQYCQQLEQQNLTPLENTDWLKEFA